MMKIYNSATTWLKAVGLLVALCFSVSVSQASTTTEKNLGELVSGMTYSIPANTHATATFSATSDGVVKLTSSLSVNSNLVPYSDAAYETVIICDRDETTMTKSFAATAGSTYYFQCTTGINGFDVTFNFEGEESGEPAMVVTPAGGTEDAPVEISDCNFTIKFTGVSKVDFNEDINWIELLGWGSSRSGTEGWFNKVTDFSITRVDDTTLSLTPTTEDPIANGNYQLSIPAGEFWYDGDTSNANPDTYLYYTYTGGGSGEIVVAITVTPEDGGDVTELSTVTVAFDRAIEIVGFENNTQAKAQLLNSNDEVVSEALIDWHPSDWSGKVSCITFDPAITTAGTYTLVIPAGAYDYDASDSQQLSPELRYTYNVTGGGDSNTYTITLDPKEGTVDQLSTLTLTFNGVESATPTSVVTDMDMGDCIWLHDSASGYTEVYEVTAVEGSQTSFTLTPVYATSITKEDTYRLVIPAGGFYFNGDETFTNSEYTANYTISTSTELNYTITLDPAEGAVDKFTTFTLTFNGVESVTPTTVVTDMDMGDCIWLHDSANGYTEVYEVAAVADSQTSFTLTPVFASEVTAVGSYKLSIPAGGFYFNGNEALVNDAHEIAYTIEGTPVPDYTFVAEPAEGNVPSIEYVALTFTPSIVSVNQIDADVTLTKGGEVIETIPVENLLLSEFGAAPALSAVFEKEYTDYGTYTVTFPAGVVTLEGGITSEEITLTYNILSETGEYTVVVNPKEGVVDQLLKIVATFEGVSKLSVPSDIGPSQFPYYGILNDDNTITKVQYGLTSYASGNIIEMDMTSTQPVTAPGNYVVIIPAGYVNIDGVALAEDIRFDYTIEGENPEYTLVANPASGDVEISELYEIEITFDGAKAVEFHDMGEYPAVYSLDENGNRSKQFYGTYDLGETGFVYSMVAQHRPYLEPGKYQFVIPANYVTITGSNDVSAKNVKEIVIDYTVVENSNTVTVVVSPTPECTVEALYHFDIAFEGAASVEINADMLQSGAKLYTVGADGTTKLYSTLIAMPTENGAMLDVMADAATAEGEYKLMISAGMFIIDGLQNEELNYTYYIGVLPVTNVPMEIDVEEGIVTSIKDFTLTFPESEVVEFYEGNNIEIATYVKDGANIPNVIIGYTAEITGNSVKLTGDAEVTAAGDYYLYVPEGFFLVDGKRSAEKIFEYSIPTGVAGVAADVEDMNVYSIDGVLILRNAKTSDLKQLDKGIYIVNGKKIFVL